jgi:hypothetical protein
MVGSVAALGAVGEVVVVVDDDDDEKGHHARGKKLSIVERKKRRKERQLSIQFNSIQFVCQIPQFCRSWL